MVKIRNSYTRLYLNKLEHNACVIRRFTHRPPGNGESDASIAFWLRKGHSAGKPLPQLAIREDAKFFVQNWTKKLFFANKDPKTNFDEWMIPQKHVLSFKCNDFFKMANLKAISSSATLNMSSGKRRPSCLNLNVLKKSVTRNRIATPRDTTLLVEIR